MRKKETSNIKDYPEVCSLLEKKGFEFDGSYGYHKDFDGDVMYFVENGDLMVADGSGDPFGSFDVLPEKVCRANELNKVRKALGG